MRNDMNKKKAFTTAELMIAIAVIGVLAVLTIPVLRYHVQEKVFEYSGEIQAKKLAQAVTMLSMRSSRMSYSTTEAFVKDLRKYARISKMCASNEIAKCWPYEKLTLVNGSLYNMSGATGPSVFTPDQAYKRSDADDNVSFVTDSGAAILINYNKLCDPAMNDENKTCYMALMDVNGDKTPNKVGEDVFLINAKSFVVSEPETPQNSPPETTGTSMAPPLAN